MNEWMSQTTGLRISSSPQQQQQQVKLSNFKVNRSIIFVYLSP
jgi:hypothetical protein